MAGSLLRHLFSYHRLEFADVHEFATAVKQALSQMQSTEAIDAKQADQPRPKQAGDTAPSVIAAQPEPETSTDTSRESGPGDELPFRKLGHYDIVERIGHGGAHDDAWNQRIES